MSYYNENIHSLRSSKDDSLISSPRRGADEYILLLERLNNLNSNKAIKNKSKKKKVFILLIYKINCFVHLISNFLGLFLYLLFCNFLTKLIKN
jgi:hypothetical protein